MTEILSELYVACDPNEPADDNQYVDLRHVRGGNAFVQGFERRLHLATTASRVRGTYVRALFSGHSG